MSLRQTDTRLTLWMARNGPRILRVSLGIVFLWFGVLKFVPGLSPADDLAGRTIERMSFEMVKPDVSRPILAAWETVIGLGLVSGVWLRATLLLLGLQMAGTFAALVLFPDETWKMAPVVPTLEGQYIIKNVVLIAAALAIGATVRGGAIVASRRVAAKAKAEDEAEGARG